MGINYKEVARKGIRAALEIRIKNDIPLARPFPIYDFLLDKGITVRFVDIPSMEGMYVSMSQANIFISSSRPAGRQVFTCAHEYGHHVFKHGTKVDELILNYNLQKQKIDDELLVNIFAAELLIPREAVIFGFKERGWYIKNADPIQFFRVSCWLGVSYSALVNQICYSFKIISKVVAENLLKIQPKQIRSMILGEDCPTTILVIDELWDSKPIDIQEMDLLLVDKSIEINCEYLELYCENEEKRIFKAKSVGQTQIGNSEWSNFVRISRKSYQGLVQYRFLKEETIDE